MLDRQNHVTMLSYTHTVLGNEVGQTVTTLTWGGGLCVGKAVENAAQSSQSPMH